MVNKCQSEANELHIGASHYISFISYMDRHQNKEGSGFVYKIWSTCRKCKVKVNHKIKQNLRDIFSWIIISLLRPSGPPCSPRSQQLLLPGPVQRRGEELGGGAAPGRAAAELPADPGLLLHRTPQHERRRPVPAHVHRRLPPDPADHGEGHGVFPQGNGRPNEALMCSN